MNKINLPEWLSKASDRRIENVNDDHSNLIVSILNAQYGIEEENAKMKKLEVNGYYT